MNVVLGGSRAGERRKDDAVRKGNATDLERCEESRRLGGGGHLTRVAVGVEFGEGFEVKLEAGAGWMESDMANSHFLYPQGSEGYF